MTELVSTVLAPTRPDADESYMVTTRDGITFDSRDSVWPVSARLTVSMGRLRELFDDSLLEGLEATMRAAASRQAASTVANLVKCLRHFHRVMWNGDLIRRWHEVDLRNYRAKLVAEFGHEDYLIKIRPFLKLWRALRHSGVSDTTWAALSEMRLKLGETGRAVRTQDSDKGPLSPEETHQLTLGVYRAADEGQIALEDLSLILFHILTGRRAGQSAALKCKDVDGTRRGDPKPGENIGEQLLLLHVPRLKQKGHKFRQTRRSVHLLEVYFALFEAQKSLAQAELRRLLSSHGFELQEHDLTHLLEELPLYPYWASVHATLASAAEQRGQSHAIALQTLRVHAEGQQWHLSGLQVARRLHAVCEAAGAQAADGQLLVLGGTRLRYTKGTDLARQGVGLAALAWLLDHSNLSSAAIYIDNLPEHAAQLNSALSGSVVLKRVASLFRGELVDSEADAVGGDEPQRSRIHYKGDGAATCGKLKPCGMGDGIPLACYTCDRFQPWLDGPHDVVLYDLLAERKRNAEVLGDSHPVTCRRDKTIAAVINVMQRCEARKSELAAQRDGAPSNE